MSIRALTNREAGDAFPKIYPAGGAQQYFPAAAVAMAANQTNTIVQKFIWMGANSVGRPTACKFLWLYSSGVDGSGSFAIKSVDLATTYYQANFTFGTPGPNLNVILDATAATAMPDAQSTLVFCYTTTADFNHPTDAINGFLLSYN